MVKNPVAIAPGTDFITAVDAVPNLLQNRSFSWAALAALLLLIDLNMNPDVETETKPVVRARELPATLKPLEKLAWNYWWSWAPDGPEIFRDLDPGLWQQCEQNPRALLAQTSDLRFAQMAADPAFAERLQQLSDRFD